ncbi:hypothetical protein BC830DRAFT_1152287 [Chytriomyces sp. MP71]|nr:hypothetical protein BC830DRAFT_1152287 [Chytriomyces sp. MP71]
MSTTAAAASSTSAVSADAGKETATNTSTSPIPSSSSVLSSSSETAQPSIVTTDFAPFTSATTTEPASIDVTLTSSFAPSTSSALAFSSSASSVGPMSTNQTLSTSTSRFGSSSINTATSFLPTNTASTPISALSVSPASDYNSISPGAIGGIAAAVLIVLIVIGISLFKRKNRRLDPEAPIFEVHEVLQDKPVRAPPVNSVPAARAVKWTFEGPVPLDAAGKVRRGRTVRGVQEEEDDNVSVVLND